VSFERADTIQSLPAPPRLPRVVIVFPTGALARIAALAIRACADHAPAAVRGYFATAKAEE
jgi:hypothetical protein